MPLRLIALPPGEFIKQHLLLVGGMNYVGAIYASYKAHLRAAGLKYLASRRAMDKYIYLANRMGLIAFDHAEAIGDGLLPDYVREPWPQAPSPRHYYRIVDPDDKRWHMLEASYRQSVGLPPVVYKPPVKPPVEPVPPPFVEVKPPKRAKPPAPPKPPKPPRVPKVAPPKKVAPPAMDISRYEQRYEDIRRQAAALVTKPVTEELAGFKEKVDGLQIEIENVRPKAKGPEAERLAEIQRHLLSARVDIDALWASLVTLRRETLARRKESAQRSVDAAGRVLLDNLPELGPVGAPPPVELGALEYIISELEGLLDPSQKSRSLEKLEKAIAKLTPEQTEAIEGLAEVTKLIADYRGIPQKGMTPEDYQTEKESAWGAIEEAMQAMSGEQEPGSLPPPGSRW